MSNNLDNSEPIFTILIDGKEITPSKFFTGVTSFFEMIKEVTDDVGGKKNTAKWTVSVESGSNKLKLYPRNISKQLSMQIALTLISGITILENSKSNERPKHFTDSALESFRRIANLPDPNKKDITKVQIILDDKYTNITKQSVVTIDKILGGEHEALGSIEGILKVVSSMNEFHVFIYDDFSKHKTRCDIGDNIELKKKSLEGFDRKVLIQGLISYRKDGLPASITATAIRVFKEQSELPTVDDMRGILSR